jgi:hypothetical protein
MDEGCPLLNLMPRKTQNLFERAIDSVVSKGYKSGVHAEEMSNIILSSEISQIDILTFFQRIKHF